MIKSLHKKIWTSILILVFNVAFSQENITVNLTNATGNWTVPCGVTSITVEVWGAGGAGGKATTQGQTTGGGGGGGFSRKVINNISFQKVFNYTIGQGGVGNTANSAGGDTWFGDATTVLAYGGKGVVLNSITGALGGAIGIGDVRFAGGKGGNGSGVGARHGSGGGGGAASTTAIGGNGINGAQKDLSGGIGGEGGASTTPGGPGGKGAGSDGNGTAAPNNIANVAIFGGGGGGSKKGIYSLIDRNGGNGRPGFIRISYVLPAGAMSPIGKVTTIKKTVVCDPASLTLTAEGGNIGSGVSTLWFRAGTTCPQIPFADEFTGASTSYTLRNATIGDLVEGNRTFVSTSNDPQISMASALAAKDFDPNVVKYISVRYRVVSTTNNVDPGLMQVFYKRRDMAMNQTTLVSGSLVNDQKWHVMTLDMSTSSSWRTATATGAQKIDGFRLDFATVPGVTMELDYVTLSSVVFLENNNTDDKMISVQPLINTKYGVIRMADQHMVCNNTVSITDCTTLDVMPVDKKFVTIGDWNDANNWMPSGIPNLENSCVTILNGAQVNVNVNNAEAFQMKVESGANLVIQKGRTLKVKGRLTNLSGSTSVILENDANLIQENNVVNQGVMTVRRESKMKRLDYTFWGSPVVGQQLKEFSPETINSRFYEYNEADDLFRSTDVMANFIEGKGYSIRAANNFPTTEMTFEGNFIGVPNNGLISYPIKWSTAVPGTTHTVSGYNLVGNPYPSNINFDLLYAANSALIEGAAYFWTNYNPTPLQQQGTNYSGNNYAVYNLTGGTPATSAVSVGGVVASKIPDGAIKVGQGFMIKAKTTGNLIFNNGMRYSKAGNFFPSAKNDEARDRFWINHIAPTDVANTILLGYVDGATNDFEMAYDAPLMTKASDAIFSILNDQNLSIQGKAFPLQLEDQIPLGVSHFSNGTYTISLGNTEGIFVSEQDVFLKDLKTGSLTNLSKGDYTYQGEVGTFTNRFVIVYKPAGTLGTIDTKDTGVQIYQDGEDFVVRAVQGKLSKVVVYDMSGRLVLTSSPNQKEYRINAAAYLSGVYMVNGIANGKSFNKKIRK